MTKYVLCAINATETTIAEKIGFITCWDEAQGEPDEKAKSCAAEVKLDWDTISTCVQGSQAAKLQLDAAVYFEERFPSHAHSGIFHVPNIVIDGEEQSQITYDSLLKAVCSAPEHITAGACGEDAIMV